MRKWLSYFAFAVIALVAFSGRLGAQNNPALRSLTPRQVFTTHNPDLFGTARGFIKNVGQYGNSVSEYPGMGTILYGYEGLGMPVLFTSKGWMRLQRKIERPE